MTEPHEAVRVALRVVLSTGLTTALAFWIGLDAPHVAAATAYMVLFQYPNTAFQKAVERILGRLLGIGLALAIVAVGHGRPFIAVPLEAFCLLGIYYAHFSGRLAYTFLQSGLYLSAVTLAGISDPAVAWTTAGSLTAALFLGVAVALPVNWLFGHERGLEVRPGGHPLWPINPEWLSHAAMLVTTVGVTEFAGWVLALPTDAAVTSVLVLTTTTDRHAMVMKGRDRLAGALSGGAWVVAGAVLLGRLPYLPVLLAVYGLGTFVAVYWSLTSKDRPYAGQQMGLVLALAFIAPPHVPGERHTVEARLEGILIGLAAGIAVAELWPSFSRPSASQKR